MIQGDPNRNFLFQMAIFQKWYIFDPRLVNPKWVWRVAVFCVKNKFYEENKKITRFSKKKENCPLRDSNPGPLICQSRAISEDHGGELKYLAIFHVYISNAWKNQLTLKKLPPLKPEYSRVWILRFSRQAAVYDRPQVQLNHHEEIGVFCKRAPPGIEPAISRVTD